MTTEEEFARGLDILLGPEPEDWQVEYAAYRVKRELLRERQSAAQRRRRAREKAARETR